PAPPRRPRPSACAAPAGAASTAAVRRPPRSGARGAAARPPARAARPPPPRWPAGPGCRPPACRRGSTRTSCCTAYDPVRHCPVRPLRDLYRLTTVRVPGVPSVTMARNGGRDTSTAPELQEDPDMTVTTSANAERLLTPGEVAALFRVDPKTVTRWASAGRIGSIRTPGGHRRFRESEVREMLADLTSEATVSRIH